MRYIILLLVGALLGAGACYYFFVGAPRVKQARLGAQTLQAPDAAGDPPGTLVLTLDEKFFETFLSTIFRDLNPPTFRLGANTGVAPDNFNGFGGSRFVNAQGGCSNQIAITQEGGGAKTAVALRDNQISTPLAFNGTYSAFGNCVQLRGAAQATIALSFDRAQQTLYGQINVVGVNLENVSPIYEPLITTFVQSAINQKVNPLVIMRGQQLTLNVPVQASGGTVHAQAKDVRAEIKNGALRLHISYDFAGAKGAAAPAQPQS
ncbi:MAG: hypothetical protein LC746_07800 [Acidobacteria bacterium]|nr:hypothetical protein [Acidobacteriota bacterium]